MNGKRKCEKGHKGNLNVGAIQWMAVLFIGLFVIGTISGIFGEGDLNDYVYTTTSNSTYINFNSTINASHNVAIAAFSTISGETADKTLAATVENKNVTNSFTITTYLNGASIGTFSALNGTNTTHTYTSVALVGNATNNITYTTTSLGAYLNNYIRTTAAYYPTSTTDSSIGGIYSDLNTKTGTVYKVLVLVLIVILLAVAMRSLGGLSGAGNSGTSM